MKTINNYCRTALLLVGLSITDLIMKELRTIVKDLN